MFASPMLPPQANVLEAWILWEQREGQRRIPNSYYCIAKLNHTCNAYCGADTRVLLRVCSTPKHVPGTLRYHNEGV
jgi:hypothetical protein